MEVGQSPYEIVVGPNCIAQGLTVVVSYYSFISVLLYCLLHFCSASSSSVLLCSPQHVDLSLVTSNQCHNVTHVGRICCDTMALLFELVKHYVVEVDPILKGCNVLMLCIQILISLDSISPGKELVCP